MSNFSLYLIGFLIATGGLAYGAYVLGVPTVWIGVGAAVLLGIGIVKGVSSTRHREAPANESPANTSRVVVDDD